MSKKLPKWLFWWESFVLDIIWTPFWWIILCFVVFLIPFLRVWWWIFIPIILAAELKTLYRWWIAWDFAYAKTKWVMLELLPPKEILTPFKAMEDVFAVTWPVWDGANWREIWCEGELDNSPYWFSFEVASIEGEIHFYARVMAQHRTMLESILYSHFPEIEIKETSDYVNNVPKNIPNEEWDVYGEDFITYKHSAYPIRTYDTFFEPQGERISAEEKRIDPMVSLLEMMSKIGPGEQYWAQFIIIPIGKNGDKWDDPWIEEARGLIDKIAKRAVKKPDTFVQQLRENFYWMIFGPTKEGSGDKATYSWASFRKDEETGERELLLTPGEREIVLAIENKIKKPAYHLNLRGVYVAKREKWKSPHRVFMRSYTAHFKTENLNSMGFTPQTRPRVHFFMRKRRAFLRARKMFRNAVERLTPLFPKREGAMSTVNTEELASLFHFPLKITGLISPTLSRVESKKGGPPPNLPIE